MDILYLPIVDVGAKTTPLPQAVRDPKFWGAPTIDAPYTKFCKFLLKGFYKFFIKNFNNYIKINQNLCKNLEN